jgi:hypothetical protein
MILKNRTIDFDFISSMFNVVRFPSQKGHVEDNE